MSRLLILVGIGIIVLGLLWPWLSRLGLGRLPGDISLHREHFHFYFPITTSIIISLLIALLLYLFRR